jgi:hypothetical protein
VEDPDLKEALGAVGLVPPTRAELSGPMLDAEYAEVKAADKEVARASRLLQLSTDGWKRRACARGTPLINIMVLVPAGGSFFYKVVPVAGVVKNAAWIKEQHLLWVEDVVEGELERVLGMVMDNTKANRCVILQLAIS